MTTEAFRAGSGRFAAVLGVLPPPPMGERVVALNRCELIALKYGRAYAVCICENMGFRVSLISRGVPCDDNNDDGGAAGR